MKNNLIINIGRQFGSGGKSIAVKLGKLLDIPVYDDELITRAAEESGLNPSLFKDSDEKRRTWRFGSFFGASRYGNYDKDVLGDDVLFRIQSETIRHLASKGPAIFIGRASNYVLRDLDTVDIFICAPASVRARYVAEREGIGESDAEELLERRDTGRAHYYNFFTMGHWGKASEYDLCIDSSVLGFDGTALFIADYCRRRYPEIK